MKLRTKENRIRLIWGISLLLLWGCAIALFVHANGKLTVQELLQYQPKSKPMAALAMCALFLLKSVDFLIYSGLLYSISGIIFPFPGAVAVNIVGMFIISVVPYFVGKSLGSPILKYIQGKYPKFREIEGVRSEGVFSLTLLLRCLALPYNIAGLYMGAREYSFRPYLLGSMLGLLPKMISYTLMGSSASDFRSPVFIGALAADLLLCVVAILIYRRIRKQSRRRQA